MKRIFVLGLACFCALLSWSQSPYLPFVEEGKTWVIELNEPVWGAYTQTFVLRGDTIIGGVTAKKLYNDVYGYECALFEEGGKVMCFPQQSSEPTLLYQFAAPGTDLGRHPVIWSGKRHYSRPENSEMYYLVCGTLKSLSWSYVENNGVRRIVQKTLSNSENEFGEHTEVDWVEGIGYLYGPSTMHIPWEITGHYGARILSVTVGDRILYNVTGVAPTFVAEPTSAEVFHSLDGRRLSAPPQHGVYLRNGKKAVR